VSGPTESTPPVPGLPELELRRLSVHIGSVAALSRVSATLPAGEITCVLGENG
jgi:simple sugar transport system ATP-binding protein